MKKVGVGGGPVLCCLMVAAFCSMPARSEVFPLPGGTVTLTNIAHEAGVIYSALRFNPVSNVWNLDLTVTNRSARVISAPVVVRVESSTGTTGALGVDGVDGSNPPKGFYDMSAPLGAGLAPGGKSASRTISLGFVSGQSPRLNTLVFGTREGGARGVATTRTLDDAGLPLPEVRVETTGPTGTRTNTTEAVFGVATVTREAGEHVWRFGKDGYAPAWRVGRVTQEEVNVLPAVRLVRLATNEVTVVPSAEGKVSSPDGSVEVRVPAGTVAQPTAVRVTGYDAQNLAAPLPQGWSPLQGFRVDAGSSVSSPLTAKLVLWTALVPQDRPVVVQWEETALRWRVAGVASGAGTVLEVALPGTGLFAVVVPDTGAGAPGPAEPGQALTASSLTYAAAALKAGGIVEPPLRAASRVPELVTAHARVDFTNSTGPLPSGAVLHCVVTEVYRMTDGTERHPPAYETYIAAFQRPGDMDPNTLEARFPLRPQLLYGPEELVEAEVQVDVLPPGTFTGVVIGPAGGEVTSGGVAVTAAPGVFAEVEAVQLRRIESAWFEGLGVPGLRPVQGFELSAPGVAAGRTLRLRSGVTNAGFVLSRVVYEGGVYGLEPVERLHGDLSSAEPASGARLGGLRSSGQFALMETDRPHAVVEGIATDIGGGPLRNVPVRVKGQPWLAFTDGNGFYRTLAPTGSVEVAVLNPVTGDSAEITLQIISTAPVTANLGTAPAGPRVVSITPENGARRVPRVTAITVGFSEAVNPGTVVSGVTLLGTNGTAVPASVSLNLPGTVVTLLPLNPLTPDTEFRVLLSTNIADLTGLRLEGASSFGFTTETDALSRTGGQFIIYEPTNGLAAVYGSPGASEPESPVILVNETSGQTATILSRVDGSFTNFIGAEVDDFLSAVLVNQNGTRTVLPASRQIFRDGSVGLFNGGGILEAESDGGPVQVIVEPGAIPAKTKFKVEAVPLAEVMGELGGVQPEGGKVLGGLRIRMEGDPLQTPPDVSFPVNPAALGLEPGEPPEQRGFVLCEPIDYDGVKLFSVLDRMHFENGKLVTHSPPFPGLPAASASVLLAVPVMVAFGNTLAIVGQVAKVAEEAGLVTEQEVRNGVSNSGYPITRVPGAVVGAFPQTSVNIAPQTLRPGVIVSRANRNGFYALLFPINALDPDAILIRASHPTFPRIEGRTVAMPPPVFDFQAGMIANVLLRFASSGTAADESPPVLTVSPPLSVMPLRTNIIVDFFVRDDMSTPDLVSVTYTTNGSANAVTGLPVAVSNVFVNLGSRQLLSPKLARVPATLRVNEPGALAFQAVVGDSQGNVRTNLVQLRFGAGPSPVGGPIPPGDPNDEQAPYIVSVTPQRDAVSPLNTVVFRFNEPVDKIITNGQLSVSVHPTAGYSVDLSLNQQEATVNLAGLLPATSYSVTLNSGQVLDLSGNTMSNSFIATFRTPAAPSGFLEGATRTTASTILGAYSFSIDRGGTDGKLLVHELGDTNKLSLVTNLHLPFFPRAIVAVPEFVYKQTTNGVVETNALVIVAGGVTGFDNPGQIVWVVDVSDPLNPVRIASQVADIDPAAVFMSLRWSRPRFSVLSLNAEGSLIRTVNLQAFILGANGTTAAAYVPGKDANGDGDFVDPGDELPVPERRTFFGIETVTQVAEKRVVDDYDLAANGTLLAGVFAPGAGKPSRLQVLFAQGLPVGDGDTMEGAVEFGAQRARRILLDSAFPKFTTNGFTVVPAAIVGVDEELQIFDLTNPVEPALLNKIRFPESAGNIYTLVRSDANEYLVGTGGGLFALDRRLMSLPAGDAQPMSPGVVQEYTGNVSGRAFGGTDLEITAPNGALLMVNRAPRIRVVQVPTHPVVAAQQLVSTNEAGKHAFLDAVVEGPMLLPIDAACPADGPSPLGTANTPPNPAVHHYALVRLTGAAGPEVLVSAESLGLGGRLNRPGGKDYPAVMLTAQASLLGIASQQPLVTPLKLKRLSDDKMSELYNTYVSDSFVVVRFALSKPQRESLATDGLRRQALWSGDYFRFAFDPLPNGAPALHSWVSQTRNQRYLPNVCRTYRGFRAEYIDTPNPSFALAAPRVSGVDLQSGEFGLPYTDAYIQGREQHLVMNRVFESRSRYVGPFGRGWDFNLNARVLELSEELLPEGYSVPLYETTNGCFVATAGDVLLIDGAGGVFRFHKISPLNQNITNLPSYFNDPAINHFLGLSGADKIGTFYESPDGLFTVLFKMRDGTFLTVGPSGHRMKFDALGRLDKMMGVSPESVLRFQYSEDGRLRTVKGDRDIDFEFGYYMNFLDPDFQPIDFASTDAKDVGKIARLRSSRPLANKTEVEYEYDLDGNLWKVKARDAEELIHVYDSDDKNLMVGVGREDGTGLPGQAIRYDPQGLVTKVIVDGEEQLFVGSKATLKERQLTGPAKVTATRGGKVAEFNIDNRGRPTSFANRPFSADDAGRPVLVADSQQEAKLTYDTANPVYRFRGNLLRTERKAGTGVYLSEHLYDQSAFNRPRQSTDPDGIVTEFTYTGTQIREKKGPTTRTFFRNAYHQQEREESAEGPALFRRHLAYSIASLSPDGGLHVGTRADGMDESVTERDTYGRVKRAATGLKSLSYSFNRDGQLAQVTGLNTPGMVNSYYSQGSAAGLLASQTTTAGGGSISDVFTYDPAHKTHVKTMTRTETGLPTSVTEYFYDGQARLERLLVNGEETKLIMDGELVLQLDGPGRHRVAAYTGDRIDSFMENGIEVSYAYDANDRLETSESQGALTTLTYDDEQQRLRRRLKTKIIEDVATGDVLVSEEYTYDAAGRVDTIQLLGNRLKTFTYFPDNGVRSVAVNGRVIRETQRDSAGRITMSRLGSTRFDFSNFRTDTGRPQQEKVTLPSGRFITRLNGYDNAGRLESVTIAGAGEYRSGFDGFGNVTNRQDPDSVRTALNVSPSGKLLGKTFSDGTSVAYGYNAQLRVRTVTGVAGVMEFSYDNEGLVSSTKFPDGAISQYEERNEFLQPGKVTQGGVVQMHSWSDGRLESIEVESTGDSLGYTYDGLGRRTSADFNGAAVEFGYDFSGALKGETNAVGDWSAVFDAFGRVLSERYPSGLTVQFSPDDDGQPTAAPQLGIKSVEWLGADYIERFTFSTGLTVHRQYDTALRAEKILYTGTNTAGFEYRLTAGGRVEYERRLHDNLFDVFTRSAPAAGMRITRFDHDSTNELGGGALASLQGLNFIAGELTVPAQGSSTDPRGFFPQAASTGQRITTLAGQSVQYDAAGSVTNTPLWVRLPGQTGLTQVQAVLEYDGLGMVRKISRADGVEIRYSRDGLGRVYEKEVTGPPSLCRPALTQYMWSGNRLLEEHEESAGSFQLVRRYGYLGRYLVLVQAAPSPGGPLTDFVPMISLNGSIRGFLTTSGELLETIEYSAYGVPVFLANRDAKPASGIASTLLFQGAWFDEASGLYQFGERTLHPVIGRFLQRDSAVFAESQALFTAFNGDPAGRIDPLGTESEEEGEGPRKQIEEAKEKLEELDAAKDELNEALIEYRSKKEDNAPAALAAATADFLGKLTSVASLGGDKNVEEDAKRVQGAIGVFKNVSDMAKAVGEVQEKSKALAEAKGETWAVLTKNIPWMHPLSVQGASLGRLRKTEVELQLGDDPMTKAQFNAFEALDSYDKAQNEYDEQRFESAVAIGQGLVGLSKLGLEHLLDEHKDQKWYKVTDQTLGVLEKLLDLPEAYKDAKEAYETSEKLFARSPWSTAILEPGIWKAASASFEIGFEIGKLGIMAASDPEVGEAYDKQVKQFQDDGGWLTVFGGVLATVGADDAAWAIQNYQDASLGMLVQPFIDARAENARRTEYYLNGIKAP